MKINHDLPLKVKNRLPILMAERGIKSLSQLSKMTNINYPTLWNFTNYIHKKLDPNLIIVLCNTLDCKIEDLLYLEEGREDVDTQKRGC